MADILIINGETVNDLLTMPICIDAMAHAAVALSERSVTAPIRSSVLLSTSDSGDENGMLLMPGACAQPAISGVKVITLHPDNMVAGLPVIQGFVSLFDHTTGEPIAIINGAALTAIRTAAASGMATRLLARDNALTHGVFGAGVQARSHIEAVLVARPSIKETIIWARDHKKARQLVDETKCKFGIDIRVCTDAAEVAACDIVTTVTGSSKPIVKGEWLKPGTHLNVVGGHTPDAREVDTNAILKSHVFVETIEAAFKEAGELVLPEKEGVFSPSAIAAEIGAVAASAHKGRQADSDITLYKSLGNVSQDLFAGWRVYQEAIKAGAGTKACL